jgi:hypothetical protein
MIREPEFSNPSQSIIEFITQHRESMLQETGKNSFFKNAQKKQMAKSVCQNLSANDLQQVISMTIYRLPQTNRIYIDYPTFKLYANDDVYEMVVLHLLRIYDDCIHDFGSYFLHINLSGFTVSAADRYKNGVMIFSERCLKSDTKYTFLLEKMQILNTPNSFESIIQFLKVFIPKEVSEKIETLNKQESLIVLENILKNR